MDEISPPFKRYLQTSKTLGNIAFHAVKERYWGPSTAHSQQAERLKEALGTLRGPFVKVAQFLSTIPGALPENYSDVLSTLQAHAPAMGVSFVRRRMKNELGDNWLSFFQHFDLTTSAAASLGQVHKATSIEGLPLACKLQYPQMESLIQADLTQLKWFLSLYESTFKALETEEIQQEIKTHLFEELDYQHEALNISRYQAIFRDIPWIQIPQVFPQLSTKKLLTLSWLEGYPLLNLPNLSSAEINTIGEYLFKAWYFPFYHYGLLHGDPHPGNYTWHPSGRLNLLDFGCVRLFTPSFIQGVVDLYKALLHNDKDLMLHAYESWGLKDLSKDVLEPITQWARLLYAPLLEDKVRPLQSRQDVSWEIAAKIHKELRQKGGIRPPREFVLMDRAAVGIGSVLIRLEAKANWHRLFEELIEDFSIQKIEKRQQGLPSPLI